MNRWVSLWTLLLSLVTLSWSSPSWAQERCPLAKSGSVNDQSLKQSGRLQGGGGGASVCGTAKAAPQVLTPQSSFPYAATTFRNRSRDPQCVTVSVTSTSGDGLQSTAYLGAFAPATPALNYLGDGGGNATLSTITYGVTVPAFADFVVVVSSVTVNAAATYDLSVTGCGAVVVTSVAPNAGPAVGGTNVTIKGFGFLADAVVTIGGAAATNVSVVDDATIGATTPAGIEGAADVVVTNGDATSGTLAGGFVYVAGASTTITLATSKNPTVLGEAVSFSAALASGAGTPTGSVAFYDGAAKIGDANIVAGVATLGTSTLASGTHAITAKYAGAGAFLAATSAVVDQQVGRAATTTAFASSKNPSGEGEAITLSATVTAVQPGGGTPSGTVTFSDGGVAFITVSLDGTGKGSFTTSALATGNHELVASYAGSDTHAGSVSTKVVQAVGLPTTSTSLLTSKNPTILGESVTFTAIVATSLGGVPTGSVTFKDGDKAIATSALDGGGRATFTTAALTEGLHAMTAVYEGAPGFLASASSPFAQNVRRDPGVSGSSGTSSGAVDAGADGGTAPEGTLSAEGGGCSCHEAKATTSNASMFALALAAFVMATRRGNRSRR